MVLGVWSALLSPPVKSESAPPPSTFVCLSPLRSVVSFQLPERKDPHPRPWPRERAAAP